MAELLQQRDQPVAREGPAAAAGGQCLLEAPGAVLLRRGAVRCEAGGPAGGSGDDDGSGDDAASDAHGPSVLTCFEVKQNSMSMGLGIASTALMNCAAWLPLNTYCSVRSASLSRCPPAAAAISA
jgi:hypothetical protein